MNIYLNIAFLFIVSYFAYTGLSLAPWVPTKSSDVKRFLKMIQMKQGETFLEIGSGDGRVSLAVWKKFSKNRVKGIEIFFPLYILSEVKKWITWQKNVHFSCKNAFNENLRDYQHIYVFGMPDKMQSKIVPKFLSEAKRGAKLYSYAFSLPKDIQKQIVSLWSENQQKIHILTKK